MPAERIIAVDLGTSTSVMRVKHYLDGCPVGDRLETKPVTFNMGSTMVPTLIQKKQDTKESVYFGHDAEIVHKKTETLRNFKVDIESSDPETREKARALTAEFFGFLAKTYHNQSKDGHLGESDDKERTIISYPVKWNDETKDFMIKTAQSAGFPDVEGLDEARAAIQAVMVQNAEQLQSKGYFQTGVPTNILLIDMGAGTTDLVLCRYIPGGLPKMDILATWPKQDGTLFGGQEMDNLLKEYILSSVPEESIEIFRKKIGVEKFKAWKETVVSPALARGESVDYFSALDDLLDLLDIDADYRVDGPSLEHFTEDYLFQFPELISGCLNTAGMSGAEVDLVVLTGGHSQWYFVREILSGKRRQSGDVGLTKIQADPDRIISISLPQETVALGLAYTPLTQLDRPSRLLRPSLPGKNASIDEIRTFYRYTQWRAEDRYLRHDGTIIDRFGDFRDWRDIVSISCGYRHTVGLRSDGSVIAVGCNEDGQCSTENWRDIVSISCGYRHTVGLRSDGSVIAVGDNKYGQCNTKNWRDIVSISCGYGHTVGLRSDGSVIAVGDSGLGTHSTENWRDIVSISCGYGHTVGLRSDGSVIAVGCNEDGQCSTENWRDIVSISCGYRHTVGLRSDGSVIAVGDNEDGQCNTKIWRDIISICCTSYHTSAILINGSIIQTEGEGGLFSLKKYFHTETLPFKLF